MDLQEVGCGVMDWIELAQDRVGRPSATSWSLVQRSSTGYVQSYCTWYEHLNFKTTGAWVGL